MIIATAGHVDHGKTSLVRALTGIDTDRLEEERRRGLTIDLGFAYADVAGARWGFVDVPGHHRFVGNMLAGVAGVDVALLVIAADDGPMPQTLEHLAILEVLDIDAAVIAITKADLVDPERLAAVHDEIDASLAGSPLATAPRIPVSSVTGDGLDDLRSALTAVHAAAAKAHVGEGFRFAVDRAFSVRGAGLVVTGCVHSGQVRVGDELTVMPGGGTARVRGLRALDRDADSGAAGERLAVNLAGPDVDDVGRGHWLLAPQIATTTLRFDARLRCIGDARVRSGLEVHVHHGASHTLGRITLIDGDESRPRVHLSVRDPLALFHGDRFVLRDSAARSTLAGGTVIDPVPPLRGRTRPGRRAELDVLEDDDPNRLVPALIALRPDGVDAAALARALNLAVDTVRGAAPDAVVEGGATPLLRDRDAWEGLAARILDALRRFHAGHPQLAGMGVDELRAVLDPKPGTKVLDAALRELIRSGALTRSATRYRLPDHLPALAAGDREAWDRVRPILAQTPTQPPVVHDLARRLDLDPAALGALLARVHHTGGVVRVADNRFMLPAAVAQLAAVVEQTAAAAADGLFDARTYRDHAGIGRNLAIDLLEFFDRSGLTRRRGDVRLLVGSAEALFGSAEVTA
ncbi:MAG TPA: selenocysteine-specific translation elongation factor [Pseudomonadales bacterium]|nr:selenocysteine-specific translation elongation factor [Pseudomonadales bacterium]